MNIAMLCCAGVAGLEETVASKKLEAEAVNAHLSSQQQNGDWDSAQDTAKKLHSVHEALKDVEKAVDVANRVLPSSPIESV